jgi:hypothetical protein
MSILNDDIARIRIASTYSACKLRNKDLSCTPSGERRESRQKLQFLLRRISWSFVIGESIKCALNVPNEPRAGPT